LFNHFELAQRVYGVDVPSPAQKSAVRRAVAALVAAGEAERDTTFGRRNFTHETGWHERSSPDGERVFRYRNPAGVLIRRTPTPDEIEARARFLASPEYQEVVSYLRSGFIGSFRGVSSEDAS
jgi:hypothetical protein